MNCDAGAEKRAYEAMGYWIIDGKRYNEDEYTVYQKEKQAAEERVRLEADELSRRLGETYTALNKLLRDNPNLRRQVRTDEEALENEIYQKLLKNLARADAAPRCQWVKTAGTVCGSPRMRNHIYCFAHKEMMERRAETLDLPVVEDANSIQLAIIEVQRALIDGDITEKMAGLLLYSLQLATSNVDKTTFGKHRTEELITETIEETEALRQLQPGTSGLEEPRTGTVRGLKPEKTSPRMNPDGRDEGGAAGKMLPQRAGSEGAEAYANSGGAS